MKHADADTLERLDSLLNQLRTRAHLREKTPGTFYVKSRAYLHFHDDATGIFADVKLDFVDFTRLRATTRTEQRELLSRIDRSLTQLG
jgi:hypothetical protein